MLTTTQRFDTDFHACAVETLRYSSLTGTDEAISGSDTADAVGCFVCGTYEYDETAADRCGSLTVYSQGTTEWQRTQHIPCASGVLDMKLLHASDGRQLLACAMSAGKADMYAVDATQSDCRLAYQTCIEHPEEGLFLSLAWDSAENATNTSRQPQQQQQRATTIEQSKLSVSTQIGSLLVFQPTPTHYQQCYEQRNKHTMCGESMPVWITTFDVHSRTTVLSGGDDCAFRLWDLRDSSSTPIATSRQHTAGVTSAVWHPVDANQFCTGSYDERVLLWDQRAMTKPVLDVHTGFCGCRNCCYSFCAYSIYWYTISSLVYFQ